VGIAANQVNLNKAVFVIDEKLAAEYECPDVFINPEITEYSNDTDEMEEGCLSIPGQTFYIKRSKKIKIKALDSQGNKFKLTAKGYLARVLQHETDHLNGVLITDRARS
jgi:peptide deformylase